VWFSEIRLQRSRCLLMAVTLSHLVALVIALAMPLAPWLRIGLAVLIAASMAYAIRHHILRNSRYAVTGLKPTRDGLSIETRDDGWILCDILDSSFVTPWLTVLHLKLAQRRLPVHVVLLPDMLGADEFRRLRVWLKWAQPNAHGKDRDAML
jgi:toxin CptA